MSTEKRKVRVVSVSVPADLIDALDAYEATRGCGRSRLVTELIERFVDDLAGIKALDLRKASDALDDAASVPVDKPRHVLAVKCPHCGAFEGRGCFTPSGKATKKPHEAREAAYVLRSI